MPSCKLRSRLKRRRAALRSSLRVLVIEDSAASLAAIRLALTLQTGWSVAGHAADAHTALALCKTLNPDVVTLDLNIAGGGSLELLSTLRWDYQVPVVVVSASTYEGSPATAEALMAGAEACIDKARILLDAPDFLDSLSKAAIAVPRPGWARTVAS
jgi:chemotaxis response regulator CheB